MLAIRHSQAIEPNEALREVPAQRRESNRAWLGRLGAYKWHSPVRGQLPDTLPHPGGPITCPT